MDDAEVWSVGDPWGEAAPAPDPDGPALRLRRRWDLTTAWSLAAIVTVWAGSAAILALAAIALHRFVPLGPTAVVAIWTALGALTFVAPAERVLGRVVLRLRAPDARQQALLDPAWRAVCRRAGVAPDRYLLRVQRSSAVNASAGGGHLVAVTSGALDGRGVPLEAILAHELGHHLGGHAAMGLLLAWYRGPLRLVLGVGRAAARAGRVASLGGVLSRIILPILFILLVVSCVGTLVVP